MFRLSAVILLVVLLGATVISSASSPNEELPAGPMKEKAAGACLSCHEARIIVQQRLGKAAWTREVDKMVKWGAAVDPQDHDALVDYFAANFNPDQAPYIAPATGRMEGNSRVKAKH